jgi:hypothetical protein
MDIKIIHLCSKQALPQNIFWLEIYYFVPLKVTALRAGQSAAQFLPGASKYAVSGFGVLEVACWPLVPKFAG